jgi:glycosyltransferase involved in cell wall biosynthesis
VPLPPNHVNHCSASVVRKGGAASHTPAVSVLMAVYNGQQYLHEALDSLLAQTFNDFELVVVDDASRDETPSILRAHGQRDSRFVLLRNDSNLRLPASLNRGLAVCRAPLVARADGDDFYEPDRLEKQFRFLREHNRVGVVSCYYRTMDSGGCRLDLKKLPVTDATIRFKLLWESPLCHAGAAFRRDAVQGIGGYDDSYPVAQDYDLWARLRDKAEFGNLPQPLMKVRIHGASSSAVRGSDQSRLSVGVSRRLFSDYLDRQLDESEAAALKCLLCAYTPAAHNELNAALRLLDDLIAKASRWEDSSTWRWARQQIATAMLKQSYFRTYSDPSTSFRLLKKAIGVFTPSLISRPAMEQVLRLVLAKGRLRRPQP